MNKTWKIAFCGLGSIGSRHLRDLFCYLNDAGESYTIDLIRSDIAKSIPDEFSSVVNSQYTYEDKLDDDYDIIFVTNPTSLHFQTISKYQWHTRSMFIEKPLFSTDACQLNKINQGCKYYVACPIRYKRVIQYVKNNINPDDVLSSISICSSYLPEWRKGTDYRACYSSKSSMGGGVSLDLIHELDYVTYLFGTPTEIHNIRGKVSPLEIDSDDVSTYIAKFPNKICQIYLDYFGRKDIRKFILFSKHDTIEIDLLENKIDFLQSHQCFQYKECRDDYQREELKHFFRIVNGEIESDNDLHQAFLRLKYSLGSI